MDGLCICKPIRDRDDGLLGHLGAVDLGQVRGYLAVGEPLRGQREHHLVDAGQPALTLLDDLRLERAGHVPGHPHLYRADVSTVFERVPLREDGRGAGESPAGRR
ncbi:hypothetical protein GCM10010289_00330 [Streptomyces violascens]|uniref:Uncharacterized protein n=1 Tax=Streptomyces violascens TaxID=67381 RepID=A0ABQ3QRY4_9ACTN|nr:hypothetical protein GCM10010289_00330 [Streptomyces violascens]GHI40009.1 hypothetical protein Sviol_44170 [Streptomyces violascens]